MNKVLTSLLWKEWHEQRWKLAFGCVLLGAYTIIGLKTRLEQDATILASAVALGAFVLPILAVMDLVARERSEGSLGSLLALPVPARTTLAVKIAMAGGVCVVPNLCASLITIVQAGGREVTAMNALWLGIGASLFGLATLIWTLAFGIRQPSEARTALVGVGVIMAWVVMISLGETVIPRPTDRITLLITPFGFLEAAFDDVRPLLVKTCLVQELIGIGLLWWTARRYAAMGRTER